MSENIHHPYANFFELVMGLLPEARKLLQYFGDKQLIQQLELDQLQLAHGSFKGGKTGLDKFVTDMLYTCKWKDKDVYINLLLEHKSWLENPKRQILGYLMDAYHQQRLDWKRDREEAKQRGEPIDSKSFKHTPIISILFYHGKQPWKDYAFADQFDLPEDWLRDFIPDVKIFVIDMHQFTDEYIESIGASFLQPMLYLFKHKEDKAFLQQHSQKVFKFVEELPADEFTKQFLRTVFYFMIQTFKLKTADVEDLATQISFDNINHTTMIQETVKTAIDEAIEKGLAKGIQITKMEETIKSVLMLIKSVPTFTDKDIARLWKVKESFVKRVRKTFHAKRASSIKRFVRSVYKNIPAMKETDFLKLETSAIELWQEFKAAPLQ